MPSKKQAPSFGAFHQVKNSSQVDKFGYDPASRTLSVHFKNGGEYHYHDVPADQFEGLKKAESAGGFLAKSIKGKFKFSKIG